ncbi:MAG: hypothetical protein AAF411_29755 [Myxococcota bacterium]
MAAGFLLAERLGDGGPTLTAVRPEPKELAELAALLRRRPTRAQLSDSCRRATTLLAAALPTAERRRFAAGADLPAPRRGYAPPDGLRETLLAWPASEEGQGRWRA